MGRSSLLLARGLKIVGALLALPFVLWFLFLLPFFVSVEVFTSSLVLVTLGLAVLGGLLFGLGKIIAPNDTWSPAKQESEPINPDGEVGEGRELPPKQTD